MRCFLLCFVVFLMMSTVVIGGSPMLKRSRRQLTRSSTEGEQTTQADGGARRPRGAEGADGDTFHQVAQVLQALRIRNHEDVAESVLRLEETIAHSLLASCSAVLQADGGARRRRNAEGADALGDAFHQVAQGLQALQAAIRSQELRQEQTVALSALRQDLEQRLQRLEETGGGRANAHSNEGSDIESRLAKLEGTVQRLLRHVPTEAPQEPLEGPSVLQNESSHSAPVLTSPQPPSGSAVAAAATEAPPSEEEIRRRVELRVEELRTRVVGRTEDSPLGEKLCRAARGTNIQNVGPLLDSGADPNYFCAKGITVLTAATLFSSLTSCHDVKWPLFILERGADVNAIDRFGRTALQIAASVDTDGECLAPLIAAGADVNTRDLNGETPLHWAAKHRREGAVRKLLAAGADRNIKAWGGDSKDKTPTDIAAPDSILRTTENS